MVSNLSRSLMRSSSHSQDEGPRGKRHAFTPDSAAGNREYVAYEYEGDLPKKIVNYNEVEMPDIILEVFALEVRKSSNPSGFPTVLSTHYESDYLRVSPTSASVSFTYNNVTTTNANVFLYRYDYKGHNGGSDPAYTQYLRRL